MNKRKSAITSSMPMQLQQAPAMQFQFQDLELLQIW